MSLINKLETNNSTITRKVLVILGLAIFLNIPLSQVKDQLEGRKEHEVVAQKKVAEGWGDQVAFGSPYLVLQKNFIYPTTSETTIQVDSQEKKRGVFHVPVYTAYFKTKVTFKKPTQPVKIDEKKPNEPDSFLLYVEPSSSVQNFKVKDTQTGNEITAQLTSEGIYIPANALTNKTFYDKSLEIEITVRGTGTLNYSTKADNDDITFQGNWTKPKFFEELLPTSTQLTTKGFQAKWKINALKSMDLRNTKTVGMTHLWTGSDYSMIERAIKYGILFICLTFILMFLGEVTSKNPIHPLQYGLVGLAISMFYLLLLALSENIGFNWAYWTSAATVTGLNIFYILGFLKNSKFVKMILIEQVGLSLFFYVILTLEEKAFLVGTLGLFAALAFLMVSTRRFDWYAGSISAKNENQLGS